MAVTPGVHASGGTQASGPTTVTVSITPTATAETLLVVWGVRGENIFDGGMTLTCTYNAVSMTAVPSSTVHSDGSTNGFGTMFYSVLGTPDGSAHDIVLTVSTALDAVNADALIICASTFTGVDQATPIVGNAATTASGTSSGAGAVGSLAKTSTSGNQIFWGFGSGSSISGATQTQRAIQNLNGATACSNGESQTAAGAASVTAAIADNNDGWCVAAIDIKASAGAVTSADVRNRRRRQWLIPHTTWRHR